MSYKEIFECTQESWDNMNPAIKKCMEDNPVLEVIIIDG